jgi:hypothetical protein
VIPRLSRCAGYGQPNANISNYTLFEIAYAALSSVNSPHDKQELSNAVFQVKLDEAVVVDNTLQPNAKITGDLPPTFS